MLMGFAVDPSPLLLLFQKGVPSMKLKPLSLAALLAAGALSAQSCSLKPRGGGARNTAKLAVAFDSSALPAALAAQMKTLQVRVFRVEGTTRTGAPELEVPIGIVAGQAEYVIKGVKIGLKEIEVAILDADGNALGLGVVQHLVTPGVNQVKQLRIEIAAIANALTTVAIDLGLSTEAESNPTTLVQKAVFTWSTQNGHQSGVLELARAAAVAPGTVTYAEIKPILDENCVSCHKSITGGPGNNKLKLNEFPFKSGKPALAGNAALMAEVLKRIQDAASPMPQDDLMPQAMIDKVKAWQTAGYLGLVVSDGRFKGAIPQLKVADLLLGTVVFTGENGVKLGEKTITPAVIEADKPVKLDLTLDMQDPTLHVPIVAVPHT